MIITMTAIATIGAWVIRCWMNMGGQPAMR
jgi:hypothetical protein